MIFADATTPTWASTLAVLSMVGTGLSLLIAAIVAFFMKSQSDSFQQQTEIMRQQAGTPQQIAQPVNVTITEELHKVFASKEAFDDHVSHNTERHGQLFTKIDDVERTTREMVERRINVINEDRRVTLERLNEQFTFIRENLSAINRELQIRHKQP